MHKGIPTTTNANVLHMPSVTESPEMQANPSDKEGRTKIVTTSEMQHHHENGASPVYMHGLRFWLVTVSLAVALFVTNMEIPIVNTALVSITRDLGSKDNVGWIISSYLLGFVSVLVIFAKLSDILGPKLMMSIALFLFIVFSGACGAAQSFIQLAVFRAFQGVGGAACFAVATAMMTDLVPPEKLAKFVAGLSSVYALSLSIGPILGGVLSAKATWRWAFLINIPIATPALVVLIIAIPANFPHHGRPDRELRNPASLKEAIQRKADILGATLLLLATLSLTSAFEEAGSRFSWASGYFITLIVVSCVLWAALLVWERSIIRNGRSVEPVLPWQFFKNRAMISLMLVALFLGGPWFVAIFQLPQRYQIVHGASEIMAGVQTMPFTFAAPLGTGVAAVLAKKGPVIYVVIASAVLQTIGFALLATVPHTTDVPARAYGYQIIAGFGCGINSSTLMLLVPFVVHHRDKAVGMGVVSQLRVMGGAIVLAIATSVFNTYCAPQLNEYMLQYDMSRDMIYSVQGISNLSSADQSSVKSILAEGYNRQMIVLSTFAAAQIPASFLLWRKDQIRV